MGSSVSARELVGLLREVQRRSRGSPAEARRRAVELCLAYHLRGQERKAAENVIREVHGELGGPWEKPPVPVMGRQANGLSPDEERALRTILTQVLGAEGARDEQPAAALLSRAEDEIQRVSERLQAAKPTVTASAPLAERVGEFQERLSGVDRALERTAQEFLDRLLEAFDPEAAKAYVGQKGIKLSSFYKASVYDALCEKFSQLRAYHEKGRLVRDFRATFKKYLKQRDATERGER
ncbi:MAG: hypothetical protein IH608_08020 [Proteobacteria bacterium]|nr:hypothetical protein [Pseudomonadota bacterium]